jgi:hypothetical protein
MLGSLLGLAVKTVVGTVKVADSLVSPIVDPFIEVGSDFIDDITDLFDD